MDVRPFDRAFARISAQPPRVPKLLARTRSVETDEGYEPQEQPSARAIECLARRGMSGIKWNDGWVRSLQVDPVLPFLTLLAGPNPIAPAIPSDVSEQTKGRRT